MYIIIESKLARQNNRSNRFPKNGIRITEMLKIYFSENEGKVY